jgi:hypothetical protein
MNGVLRIDVTIARKISEKLNADDIRLLVNAFSDPDKTMCLQTTEFLYALKTNVLLTTVLMRWIITAMKMVCIIITMYLS